MLANVPKTYIKNFYWFNILGMRIAIFIFKITINNIVQYKLGHLGTTRYPEVS